MPSAIISRPMRPPGRRHLIRYCISVIAALAAAGYGAIALAPGTAAAPVRAASSTATPRHIPAAPHVPGAPDLGPNVYVFTPSMPQSQIQATVNAIASQQVPNQFGTQRYALFFEPGTYGTHADPLTFQVGYYTQVAGLGASPGDVVINGAVDVFNQCFGAGNTNCFALDNFWRSLSNLTINVTASPSVSGCQGSADFWATSQAAPMRRVQVNGFFTLQDYCTAGPQFASGGFIADSVFHGSTILNGSQQQFIVRNSNLDGWTNGVWNQVFAGDNGAPAQAFGVQGGAGPYTTLATSPVTQEEPFLYVGPDGAYRVFVPAVRHDSVGPTWTNGAAAGQSIPVSRFFIATPDTPVPRINLALALGQDLILTPGVYHLNQAIKVSRPDTIVLGLGLATLIPDQGNISMRVASVPGVKLSGLIFDAGPVNSPVLLQVGSPGDRPGTSADDPTLVQDVYFRIGGAEPGQATNSLVVNSSDVILDNIWAWRADHGAGVGWTSNVGDHGVLVTGDNVTAYGLFVEHYEKTQVIWSGQGGTDIFFQNEMPYDPPSQAAWMANASTDGYPAFAVTDNVRSFTGYGLGSYCFFNQGLPIIATEAFQAPSSAPGVRLHDLLTVFLSGSGGINSVVDGVGAPVDSSTAGRPSNVVSFP
jgi:hypothetical protein